MDKKKFALSGIVIIILVFLTVTPVLSGPKSDRCKYPCQCSNSPGWTGTCTINKPVAWKGVCWWASRHTCVNGCQTSVVNMPCPGQ